MKKIKSIAILLILFSMSRLSAQMTSTTYMIYNGQNCDITVLYEVSDCGPQGIVCNQSYLVIPPGGAYSVPCAQPGFDIYIWLLEMDYVNITPGGSNANAVGTGGCFGNQPVAAGVSIPAAAAAAMQANGSCYPMSGTYSLYCFPTYAKIGY